MIKGIGIDICQISRIKIEMSDRILSAKEKEVFDAFKDNKRKIEYLAGRFSAKESILKALTGVKENVFLREIIILNDETGKPIVVKPNFNDIKIWVSISHERDYCVGQAIIENM
jgi:holo-[acyl-carrier protein] synthase